MRSALALLAAAVVLAPQPAGAAQAPPATIVAEAEGLYRRVNAQIAKTPKQQREADAADAPPNGPSWTFQRALGHFSDHVRAAASAHEIDDSTHEVPEMTNWLAAAMKSSADMCNAAHARLYLYVARGYLDDFRAGSPARHANPAWQPAGAADAAKFKAAPAGDAHCRR